MHGLSCRQSAAGRHARHSAVNDLIKRALASADFPARLELSSLSGDDEKRPHGLSTWKEGRCLWDLSRHSGCQPYIDRAVSKPQQTVWLLSLKHGCTRTILACVSCHPNAETLTAGPNSSEASDVGLPPRPASSNRHINRNFVAVATSLVTSFSSNTMQILGLIVSNPSYK